MLDSQVCGADSTTDTVSDCNRDLVWEIVRSAVSIALAVCAMLAAIKVRTAANAWKGGIVLLIAATIASPLAGLVG